MKWALITGASSGIGRAFAQELASKKFNIVLVSRNQSELKLLSMDLEKKYNIKTYIISKDLSLLTSSQEIYTELNQEGIDVDWLINNAGFAIYGKYHLTDIKANQEQMILNMVSLASMTQLFLKPMISRGEGVIINVGSTASYQPVPYMAIYGASKSFVRSFSEALWAEYKDSGVQFLTLNPGPVETKFFERVNASEASVGKRDTPENTVKTAMKALEKKQISIISGPHSNFILSNLGRFLPQSVLVSITEKVMRPRT
ncbi:MAG: oxidoreductase [Leptospira sp.]|nr:MAG: oxidoreductase [Leptospira sp.]